jgi:HSP20 family protein
MPSVPYMNRSAPFWDFVADLEQEGAGHPFYSQNRNNNTESGDQGPVPPFASWGWGVPFGGGRGFPHHGPPPASRGPGHEDQEEDKDFEKDFQKELNKEFDDEKNGKDNADKDNGEGPSGSGSDGEGVFHGRGQQGEHRRGGHCGPRRGRQGCGPRGWGGPGPHHSGPPHNHGGSHHGHGRRGGWGGWGRWNRGGPFGSSGPATDPLAFVAALFDPELTPTSKPTDNESDDFSPEADIFDTPTAFVVHVSLPGAKKEDVGVNWDAEKSELSIAGVIYRPGDEKFLEQLAQSERKVGAFERKVRLGTRAHPASVDVGQISAKLEDGVLRVEVPKLGESGFVEVTRVDVE